MSGFRRLQGQAWLPWAALACLVVPMFGSYFFDDMFSAVSAIFQHPESLALGWSSEDYGRYASAYSTLCIFGGLVLCGLLLDRWGVRLTGSLFVGMMIGGAALVLYALRSGLPVHTNWQPFRPGSLEIAYTGAMFFGLGSEIAGTAVNRSIAKWFRGGNMAFAMGLQLAVARLGSAAAMVLVPTLITDGQRAYSLTETASPAFVGLLLLLLGGILWAIFVAIDAHYAVPGGSTGTDEISTEEPFRLRDVWAVLTNRNFLLISLLCVLFYSSIIAFKKFGGAILVPRFGISSQAAGWMISALPFSTVVFAPLFGWMVDRFGHGTRWMMVGSLLALGAHLLLGFAPEGVPFWGYLAMGMLGFGYSLVPAALWPSVPKIVPDRVLGTTFALVYWVQNLGLWLFKRISGSIMEADSFRLSGPVRVEIMYVVLCVLAFGVALLFARSADRHPELRLDAPARA